MDTPLYRLARHAGCCIRGLRTGVSYITAILFAVLFVSFVLQIFMRFILNNPLNWSEELSVLSYIWIVFLACSFILRDNQHVVFNIVTQALPPKGQHFCLLLTSVFLGGVFAAISYGVFDYIAFMKVENTPALLIRKDYIYSIFAVFVAVIIARCAWTAAASLVGLFAEDTYTRFSRAFADTTAKETQS